jgi:hypothetical protein
MKIRFPIVAVTATLFFLAACTYDPPPKVKASIPEDGAVTEDVHGRIVIQFTEPVERQSVEATLYGKAYDAEGNLLERCAAGATKDCQEPVAGPCSVQKCPGGTLVINTDFSQIAFESQDALPIGNYVLRISPGLEDGDGNATGVPFDISFFVKPAAVEAKTTFEPGVFIAWMDLERPFTFPLETYWHISVDAETGKTSGGSCDADPINPSSYDREKHDYKEWKPAPYLEEGGENGFKFVFEGTVQDVVADGKTSYYFETKPNLYIYCKQPEVEVTEGQFVVTMEFDDALGREVMTGTMTSPATSILGQEPQEVFGRVYGYRLSGAEIGTDKWWQTCASTDPATVTKKGE